MRTMLCGAVSAAACAAFFFGCAAPGSGPASPQRSSVGPGALGLRTAQKFSFGTTSIAPDGRTLSAVPRRSTGGFMLPAVKVDPVLYISDAPGSFINIYSRKEQNPTPIGQITKGLVSPLGVYVAKNGDVYAANSGGGGTVEIYHRGQTKPYKELNGIGSASDVVVDKFGNTYVAGFATQTIYVFAPGSTTYTSTLTDVQPIFFLTADSHGDIFADGYTVDEFPVGSTTPVVLPINLFFPGGLAVDEQDNLIVCDQGDGTTGTITAYAAPDYTTTLYGFSYSGDVAGIALDRNQAAVWGANTAKGVWAGQKFRVPTGKLVNATAPSGLREPIGAAVDRPTRL